MASVVSAVSQVAGAAVEASPVGGIIGVIGSIVQKALSFIPDPAQKIALQQHAMDLQAQAAADELDAVTKQVQASATAQSDPHLAKVRAVFCYSMCAAIVFGLIVAPLLHAMFHLDIGSIAIPTNLLVVFAVIMIGLVGVPQGMSVVKDIMAMQGESSVSVLGFKVGQKS